MHSIYCQTMPGRSFYVDDLTKKFASEVPILNHLLSKADGYRIYATFPLTEYTHKIKVVNAWRIWNFSGLIDL